MHPVDEVLAGRLPLTSAIAVRGETQKKDRARFVKVLRDIFKIQWDGPGNMEPLVSICRNHLEAGRGDVIVDFMAFVLKKTSGGTELQNIFSRSLFLQLFSLIQNPGD